VKSMSDEGRSATSSEAKPKSNPPQTRVKSGRPRTRDGLFKKNNWWWLDYYDSQGKRHRKKAAPDYQTAKTMYRDTMTAIARGEVLGVREEGLRFKDFADKRYWPTVKPTLSKWEQVRARSILDTQLLPRFGDTKLVKLRREDVERWQAERRDAVSASTANKELMRLSHLLNRALDWGCLKANPARGIKRAKEAPGRARYLSAEERNMLLKGAVVTIKAKDGRTWTAHREPNPTLRLYMLAALQTGARRSELLGLRWADVDMKARMLTFRQPKNGESRSVPITDTLREALQDLPRPLNPEASVFPERDPKVLSRAFARLVKDLKLPNLRFHDLRHDAASTLTMAGVPQRTVMAILGHRDPRMTMRYQHLSPDHLRDAARALNNPPMPKPEARSDEAR
jgi:integrase